MTAPSRARAETSPRSPAMLAISIISLIMSIIYTFSFIYFEATRKA